MEEKINIAKILKNKPEKTILYDAMRDINVSLYVVEKRNGETNIFCDGMEKFKGCSFVYSDTGADSIFRKGMQLLKPSKEMQDWDKFSWKRGDVLISDCGFVCIFKEWASYDYTKFNGCYFDGMPNAETAKYSKVDNNTAYGYIREIENRCGGKLNLETLKIEKSKFKDGDIVFMKGIKGGYYANCIFILRSEYKDGDERAFYYAFYNTDDKFTIAEYGNTRVHYSLRPATDYEKQQLFDALAKKGKTWDAEKKQIVDLKPKVELKPFDNVLVRHQKTEEWRANIFSHTDKTDEYLDYVCVNGRWEFCIPYEGNESLLGTTKDVEG